MRFALIVLALAILIPSMAFAATYAVVDGGGNIVNIVVWDGSSPWSPPVGSNVVQSDGTAEIGGTYNSATKTFTPAPPPVKNN